MTLIVLALCGAHSSQHLVLAFCTCIYLTFVKVKENYCYALWIPYFHAYLYDVKTLWDTFSIQKLRVPIDLYVLDLHRNKWAHFCQTSFLSFSLDHFIRYE